MRRDAQIPKHVRIRNKYLGLSIVVGVVLGSVAGFFLNNPSIGIIPGVVAGVVAGTILGNWKAKPYITEE